MRRTVLLAVAISIAGCASPGTSSPRAARASSGDPSTDYLSVSRAMTEIDAAERQGELADELRWAQAAERATRDAAAQFLAVAAQPGAEDRWSGFRDLSLQFTRSPLPWVGMARTYVAWRTWDQAEKAIATALQRDPGCWLAVGVRAELLELRGKPDQAPPADYQAVLKADPRNPEAHFGLARLARARGDLEEAHAQAAAALEGARTIPGAWAILGQIAEEIGEPGAAADFWRGAIEQAPRDRGARVALARLLTAQGDARGAQQSSGRRRWRSRRTRRPWPRWPTPRGRPGTPRPSRRRWSGSPGSVPPPSSGAAWPRSAWRPATSMAPRGPTSELLDAHPPRRGGQPGHGPDLPGPRRQPQRAVQALRGRPGGGRAGRLPLEQRLNMEKLARPDVGALQRAGGADGEDLPRPPGRVSP